MKLKLFQPWHKPKYIYNKICVLLYQKKHPHHPWINRQAISILSYLLKPSDVGLEWGSGRSTLWFARRLAKLTSVEHDAIWHINIKNQMAEAGITNVEYLFCEDEKSYMGVIDRFSQNSLDFVIVDGGPRSVCAIRSLENIRHGGILVIDDAHRFLPSDCFAPKARTKEAGPRCAPGWESVAGLMWADFLSIVADWRCIWTSDSVTCSAIYFKP